MPDEEIEHGGRSVETASQAREAQERMSSEHFVERAVERIVELKNQLERDPELHETERGQRLEQALKQLQDQLDQLQHTEQQRLEQEQRAVAEELDVVEGGSHPKDAQAAPLGMGEQLRHQLTESLGINREDRQISEVEQQVILLAPTQEELRKMLRRPESDAQLLNTCNWLLNHPSNENLFALLEARQLYSQEAATLLLERKITDEQLLQIASSHVPLDLKDQALSALKNSEAPQAVQVLLEQGSVSIAEAKARTLLAGESVSPDLLRTMVRRLPGVSKMASERLLQTNQVSQQDLQQILYRVPELREQAVDQLRQREGLTISDALALAHSSRTDIQNQAFDLVKNLAKTPNDIMEVLASWPHQPEKIWEYFLSLQPSAQQLEMLSHFPLSEPLTDLLLAEFLKPERFESLSDQALAFIVSKGSNEQAQRAGNALLEKVKEHERFGMNEEMSTILLLRLNNPELQMQTLRFVLQEHADKAMLAYRFVLSRGTEQMKNVLKEHLLQKPQKNGEDWEVLLQLDPSQESVFIQDQKNWQPQHFSHLSAESQARVLEAKQQDISFMRAILPELRISHLRPFMEQEQVFDRLMNLLEQYRDDLVLRGAQLNRYVPDVLTGGLTVSRFEFDAVLHSQSFKNYLQQVASPQMKLGESFSIIKAVIHRVHQEHQTMTEEHISGSLAQIHQARRRHLDAIIMDENTRLILATHQERRFDNQQLLTFFERAGFNRSEHLQTSVKGMELNEAGVNVQKQRFLNAIRQANTGNYTVLFSGHGTAEALWLDDGAQPTSSARIDDPRAITYREIGDALIASNNIQNIRILGMSCLSYDFMQNLNHYLSEHLPEGRKHERPIMVSAANKNSLSSGGGLYLDSRYLDALYREVQPGEAIRLEHLMRAEAELMNSEDPAIFVPDTDSRTGILEVAQLFSDEEERTEQTPLIRSAA